MSALVLVLVIVASVAMLAPLAVWQLRRERTRLRNAAEFERQMQKCAAELGVVADLLGRAMLPAMQDLSKAFNKLVPLVRSFGSGQ